MADIIQGLSADVRFVAAWLGGSFGRGNTDALSDLDLACVATDAASMTLCARPWLVAGGTTNERLALFGRFGQPAAIHENHHNAPPDATFTFVMYRDSGLVVDWTLIAQARARRPAASLLLFDKVGVPVEPLCAPQSMGQRAAAAQERLAFFSMIAVVAAKYVARGDILEALKLLDTLYQVTAEIDALTDDRVAYYRRGSSAPLALDQTSQIAAIRALAGRAQLAASTLEARLGQPFSLATKELGVWLAMAASAIG